MKLEKEMSEFHSQGFTYLGNTKTLKNSLSYIVH